MPDTLLVTGKIVTEQIYIEQVIESSMLSFIRVGEAVDVLEIFSGASWGMSLQLRLKDE